MGNQELYKKSLFDKNILCFWSVKNRCGKVLCRDCIFAVLVKLYNNAVMVSIVTPPVDQLVFFVKNINSTVF